MENIKRKLKKIIFAILLLILIFNLINVIHSKVSINNDTAELDEDDSTIKLFTYNIFAYDLNLVLPVLEESEADIIVLQELEYSYDNGVEVDGVKWLASKLNMSHFSEDGTTYFGGVSILSRWPIISSNSLFLGKIDGYIDRYMVVRSFTITNHSAGT